MSAFRQICVSRLCRSAQRTTTFNDSTLGRIVVSTLLSSSSLSMSSSSSSSSSSVTESPEMPRVYVDGSSIKVKCGENKDSRIRVGGAGIFWGYRDSRNRALPITYVTGDKGRKVEVTNNRAELWAAYKAVQLAREEGITRLVVVTDSQLVSKAMKSWINDWMSNDWKNYDGKPVENRRLYLLLWVACRRLGKVEWEHVRGHAGDAGNEEADRLATYGSGAAKEEFKRLEILDEGTVLEIRNNQNMHRNTRNSDGFRDDESDDDDDDDDGYGRDETINKEILQEILGYQLD